MYASEHLIEHIGLCFKKKETTKFNFPLSLIILCVEAPSVNDIAISKFFEGFIFNRLLACDYGCLCFPKVFPFLVLVPLIFLIQLLCA